jgi:rhodanese-related sulfurtransferase
MPQGYTEIVDAARREVLSIPARRAVELLRHEDVTFIDLRDSAEVVENGKIPGAEHCPRGSLEFRIPSDSEWFMPVFISGRQLVFYCSHGLRSVLAARTAMQMGVDNVCSMEGGFKAWQAEGGEVAQA